MASLEADVAADQAAKPAPAARPVLPAAKPVVPAAKPVVPAAKPAAGLPPPRPATPSVLASLAPSPAPTPTPAPRTPAVAKPAAVASAMFDQSDSDAMPSAAAAKPTNGSSNGSKPKPVSLADLAPVNDADLGEAPGFDDDDEDDDLQIGEVSRVVRLQDLLGGSRSSAPKPAAAAARRPAAAPLGRGSEAVQAFADSAEPASALAHAASASLRDEVAHGTEAPTGGDAAVLTPMVRPQRKPQTALLAVVGALLLAAVGLVIFLAVGNSDSESSGNVGGSGGDVEDLALTIDDPRYPQRGTGKSAGSAEPDPIPKTGTGKSGTGKTGTGKTNTGNTSGSNTQVSGTGSGTGKTEVVMGPDGPVEPLSPDDVIMQAMKMSTGTQRCYSRALKDDPFLKVKSIGALISINAAGKVTEVNLDSMETSTLGQCLAAAIKRWPFRKSTEGIDTKITLKFEQSGF